MLNHSFVFYLLQVLKDGLFENQTIENFELVMKPKVQLTKILDSFSRIHCPKLEYFVGFSSIVSGKGNMGQTNYGLANSHLERICESRRKSNFPALAIQWGAVGDVGVVHESMGGSKTVIAGTLPQPITSCLNVLEKLLYFQDQITNGIVSSIVLPSAEEGSSSHAGITESHNTDTTSMSSSILKILGLDEASILSRKDSTLTQLGMDSLMLVEVKQLFERRANAHLSNNEIRLLTWDKILEFQRAS